MRRPVILLALLAAPLFAAAPALPAGAEAGAPFVIQETGKGYATIDDAVSAVGGEDKATILIAPGVYKMCTVQTTGFITYKAAEPGKAIFDGTTCEGKAAFVLRGHSATIDGIVFRNMRVGDGNGAGIRLETGDLTVENSMFLDSQEGILGGYPNEQKILIDRTTFAGLGQCDETEDCAHSVYLTTKGEVTITRSRFERGRGGHYVKLRVPTVSITDNSFDDSSGRKTNYAIDLPEGATGLIARNSFVQGPNKENWTGFVVVSAEAKTYSSAGLKIAGNTAKLAPGVEKMPAFVANASGQELTVGANRLAAGIKPYETR